MWVFKPHYSDFHVFKPENLESLNEAMTIAVKLIILHKMMPSTGSTTVAYLL
ncbi:hypothetical protein H6F32_04530 [Anabaena sp. FACHB-1237]|uniref:hypothetical protein n=1 Tax=Anabaena sp. FACHB-1237 TaxID=2692769 RepID=UPI00167FFEFA|nr:hypothetical protein [Anabaena sp. FACHB-1237]MBD2136871.1 hypothetical protein [Anabaena sp. FACHB-1237]